MHSVSVPVMHLNEVEVILPVINSTGTILDCDEECCENQILRGDVHFEIINRVITKDYEPNIACSPCCARVMDGYVLPLKTSI